MEIYMIVYCQECNKELKRAPSHVARVSAVFCSRECQRKGQITKIDKLCKVCGETFEVHPSMADRYSTCSLKCRRISRSEENNPNWRGGELVVKKQFRKKEMSKLEYVQWRRSVFERDNYTCQDCGERGGDLEADHIMPWATHPDLRYELSNGRTMCKTCHRKTFKNLYKIKEQLRQVETK